MITVPAAGLLLALYMVIFSFSAQDGEQSGSLSQMISEKCVELFQSLSGGEWSEVFMEKLAEYFEHPIRKFAHFSEYACMGILVYVIWVQWLDKGRRLYLLTVGWVFVSAGADEFHQLFVPGRYGSFADVLLDTCGGIFGMLFCMLAGYLHRKRKIARKRKAARKRVAELDVGRTVVEASPEEQDGTVADKILESEEVGNAETALKEQDGTVADKILESEEVGNVEAALKEQDETGEEKIPRDGNAAGEEQSPEDRRISGH